jgi:hypothetical protein
MNLEFYRQQLESSGAAIQALARGAGPDQARWKPAPESWSLLEVVNHLLDEEREDFRAHLANLLQQPPQPWTLITPQLWVEQRGYNQRDYEESLAGFLSERAASLVWLTTLTAPDWQASYAMPWGPLTAGDLLASWAAHDLLHLRQLTELRYAWMEQAARPHSLQYAGDW